MYCKNCGKEIHDEAVMCIHCGVATGKPMDSESDEPASGGLIVLSVLFPAVGLIMGAIMLSNGKKKAGNAYIKAAVITMAVGAVLSAFSYIMMLGW